LAEGTGPSVARHQPSPVTVFFLPSLWPMEGMLSWVQDAVTEAMDQVVQCQSRTGCCARVAQCQSCCGKAAPCQSCCARLAECESKVGCCGRDATEGVGEEPCDVEFAISKQPPPVFNNMDWLENAPKKEEGLLPLQPRLSSSVPPADRALETDLYLLKRALSGYQHDIVIPHDDSHATTRHSDAGSTATYRTNSNLDSNATEPTLSDWNDSTLSERDSCLNEEVACAISDCREHTFLGWYEQESKARAPNPITSNVVNVDDFSAHLRQQTGNFSAHGRKQDSQFKAKVVSIDEYTQYSEYREQTLADWDEDEMDLLDHLQVEKTVVSMDDYNNFPARGWPSSEHEPNEQPLLLDDEAESAELADVAIPRTKSAPLPTLLRQIGRGDRRLRTCFGSSFCDQVKDPKADRVLSGETAKGISSGTLSEPGRIRRAMSDYLLSDPSHPFTASHEKSQGGSFSLTPTRHRPIIHKTWHGKPPDKETEASSADDSKLLMFQSQLAGLTRENASLRDSLESLRADLATRGEHVASQDHQCSALLRHWAAKLIQSAERARVARRRAALLREARKRAMAEEAGKTGGDAPSKATPPPKGKGKGVAPPAQKGRGKGAPGCKSRPLPTKPDVIPSIPLKKLFWNPIILGEAPGLAEHSTLWSKIHQAGASFDESGLEALFADAPPNASHSKFGKDSNVEKPKLRRLFGEKRRRQIWFMVALLPERNHLPDGIMNMDDTVLEPEKVYLLVANLPTSEEETMITAAMRDTVLDDGEVWDVAEAFAGMLIAIPQYALRLQVWGFSNAFLSNFAALTNVHDELQAACNVLETSLCIEKLMALTLYVGNYLNGGTPRGRADGFDLETLSKLAKLKSSDREFKGTLIDFIVQQMQEDNLGMLADMFAPQGEFHTLHRARRHRLNESEDELGRLVGQAEEYLQKIGNQADLDEPLMYRKEQLLEQSEKLRNLSEDFNKLKKRYADLCAWLCMDTGKLKPTDEFFGVWHAFLVDVKKGLETFEKKQRAIFKASQSISRSRFLGKFRKASASPEPSQCGTSSASANQLSL